VKKLEYWKISALIGAIIFLASGFLPFISYISAGGGVASSPLTDIYSGLGLGMDWGTVFSTLPMYGIGWLLAMILYPVTVVLGLASFLRRKLALFAGILGIICGIGEIMMISGLQSLLAEFGGAIEYGYGIFVGFAGAIIMLAANYIKGGTVPQTPTAPPPPPPT
jgi:hypothetical protein